MKYTFWFECTDNGGGHQAFEVKAENKQEAIKKGMAFAKKHASGDICGDWECKMISEWTTRTTTSEHLRYLHLNARSVRRWKLATINNWLISDTLSQSRILASAWWPKEAMERACGSLKSLIH